MSENIENPKAFPRPDVMGPNDVVMYGDEGMTLRDYFAANVAQGLAAFDSTDSPEWIASHSYAVASAMLKERSRNK